MATEFAKIFASNAFTRQQVEALRRLFGLAAVDTDRTVPFFLPAGETYTVAENKQALFSLPIELEGDAILVVDGALIEVD